MFVRIELFLGLFFFSLSCTSGGVGITVKRPKLNRSVRIDMGIDILFIFCRPKAPYGVFEIRRGGGGGAVDARSAGLIERKKKLLRKRGIERRS